ncbi:MAG TPA: S8 family serine peptidase [Candidatus Deferrimicrobium sp.]|nr:S8 family serine peptidase [Candidatus Deferrimicrobium sp.]
MKTLISVPAVLALIITAGTIEAQEFYYGTDAPIMVVRDSSKVLLKLAPSVGAMTRDATLDSIGRIAATIPTFQSVDEFIVCSLSTGTGYEAFLDSVQAIEAILFAEPFYLLKDNTPLYIGQSFCVAFDSLVTGEEVDSINAMYGVNRQRELRGMPNVFVLLNTEQSGYRTLELANVYHNLPETRFAHPNFGLRIRPMAYKLYDYYNGYQPHTKKVIGSFNSASVWDFAGLQREVTVAVLDDGVDSHEDLPSNRVLPGYDFADSETDTRPGPELAHGMGCAGIIAASHTPDSLTGLATSSGVISLNPHVRILPVNIFDDSGHAAATDSVAEAVTYAYTHGADILSNSWGWSTAFYDYPALTQALEKATVFGRGGRGCPVIFASGNNTVMDLVAYPANLEFCFAVGATQLDDYRWSYSAGGIGLDLVAPSGDMSFRGAVWTLDQMGDPGYNPSVVSDCPPTKGPLNDEDYDCHFGGTSGACPVVSGTAALIMSKDSTLNFQGFYYILKYSAETDLDWGSITPPDVEYGYGRVDAFRAVLSISRGNVDNIIGPAGEFDVSDLTFLVAYVFGTGQPPFPSVLLGDCDCDAAVTVTDVTYLTDFLFSIGPPPVRPCFEY